LNEDDSVTVGTEMTFHANGGYGPKVAAVSENKAIVIFPHSTGSRQNAVPLTLNEDGTITAGSAVVFSATYTTAQYGVIGISENKAIAAYRRDDNKGYVCVLTISFQSSSFRTLLF
jgi:hypothetical protein